MALDFLSSDIVFPSGSSEPKLAPGSVSKLPEPVDWAFHDLYSTAHEKASMPLHSLTDYAKLHPLLDDDDGDRNEDELAAFSNSLLHNNKSNQSLFLMPSHRQSSSPSAPPPIDQQKHMRAILCGALKAVNNSMQDNHLTRLDKYKPSYNSTSDQTFRWEDELLLGWSNTVTNDLHLPDDYSDYDDRGETSSIFAVAPEAPLPVLEDDDDDDFDPSSPLPHSSLGSSRSFFDDHLFIPSPPPPSEPFRYVLPPPVALPTPVPPAPFGRSGTPNFSTSRSSSSATEGKQAITKSNVWQNLVSRLKKNLALPKSKESQQQDHDRSSPHRLKRFFKSRQN